MNTYIYIYIYMCVYTYIYIYIYISSAANLGAKIMDLRGVDSSRILISRGGIPRPIRSVFIISN